VPALASEKVWYLVYTKPRQESVAKLNLERQHYSVYLPLVRHSRKRLGRRIDVIEPLFPRYLFIELSTQTDNWGPIRSTVGVSSLVRFGAEPAAVPGQLIACLRARDNEQGVQLLAPRAFAEGDSVRIAAGPMWGYEGIFLATTGKQRVMVLLEILGKQTRVSVAAEDLEAGE
jgi:transcriptional antiterminator RfaH